MIIKKLNVVKLS